MIWKSSYQRRRERLEDWSKRFAYVPTDTNDGNVVWLGWYEEKRHPLTMSRVVRRPLGSSWEPAE